MTPLEILLLISVGGGIAAGVWKGIKKFHYVTVVSLDEKVEARLTEALKKALGINGLPLLEALRKDLEELKVHVALEDRRTERHEDASTAWARGTHEAGKKAGVDIPDPDDFKGMQRDG